MTERTHIDEWFEQLPEDVVSQTQRLLEHVDTMRQTETIYPAQENILNALALTAPANVRVVILGQDPTMGRPGHGSLVLGPQRTKAAPESAQHL